MSGYHSPQVDVEVRLNTNESPDAPPAEFLEQFAAAASLVEWNRYPDRGAEELRAAIARHHEVGAAQVFAANGSNEVLQTLMVAYGGHGRSASMFEPTYALHSHISRLTGTRVESGTRASDFGLDSAEVERVFALEPDVVFLCSPNNPTGVVERSSTVEELLGRVESWGGILVVDEAYGQFWNDSALRLVANDRNLVVTRTYSKTWAMAGARLGYLVGPDWLVVELDKVVLPYHLDHLTQLAGTLALDHVDAMAQRVERLVAERNRVTARLGDLAVTVWPSGANFILFRPEGVGGEEVWQALVDRSVLVRNCASWPGLEGCLRVTIGTPEENTRFLAELERAVGTAG